jgi:hypothetical protein
LNGLHPLLPLPAVVAESQILDCEEVSNRSRLHDAKLEYYQIFPSMIYSHYSGSRYVGFGE